MNATSAIASVQVSEIAFTAYPVTDIARAREFYENVLGLKTSAIWQEGGGPAWIEYDIGPGTIAITNTAPEQWKPSADGPSVALEVVDFDAAVAALRSARVTFRLEPTASPACRLAVICDPDGNAIAIHKRNAK